MSNNDLTWTAEQAAASVTDGWLLAVTVDEGKTHGYLHTYPHGPRFKDPTMAMRWVVENAQRGSKFHIAALRAIAASRVPITPTKRGSK
jgi:hypothetical protein